MVEGLEFTFSNVENQNSKNKLSLEQVNYLSKMVVRQAFDEVEDPGSSTLLFYFIYHNLLFCYYIGDS